MGDKKSGFAETTKYDPGMGRPRLKEGLITADTGIFLRIEQGADSGRVFTLSQGGVYLIGRAGADIPLDDEKVSRKHAEIGLYGPGGLRIPSHRRERLGEHQRHEAQWEAHFGQGQAGSLGRDPGGRHGSSFRGDRRLRFSESLLDSWLLASLRVVPGVASRGISPRGFPRPPIPPPWGGLSHSEVEEAELDSQRMSRVLPGSHPARHV